MDLGLRNKAAIVTGGAGGIGREIVCGLAREGCRVCILDLNEEGAATAAREIADETGQTILAVKTDVTDRASVTAAFEQAVEAFDALHVLVNSHQLWPKDWFTDITDEAWRKAIDVNLTSYFLTCQAMVRHMRAKQVKGSILNITSQAAFRGATTGHAHYAAAKAGILGLTKSIAREAAADGINVNDLAPGMAMTPATEGTLKQNMEAYLKRIPLGRIAEPREVADVAVFLVSERARYMTGTTVDISGGMLMR